MKRIRVESLKNQALIADKCDEAERFFDRLKGLIGRAQLAHDEALWIPRCNSVHMWLMSFSIDVVFVKDAAVMPDGKKIFVITSLHSDVPAGKLLPLFDFRASHALELAAGSIAKNALSVGDELCIG